MALSGMGVGKTTLPALAPAPPPPPEEPGAGVVDEPARDVPPTAVLALEEMPVVVLVSTFALEPAVEPADSAELVVTVEAPDAVLRLPAASADVEEAGEETPFVAEGVNKALPAEAAPPAPAPEEEPAVFDDEAEDDALVAEDWM